MKRDEGIFEVLWPLGRKAVVPRAAAATLGDLSGKTVAELWDYIFRGEVIYPLLREKLRARYPGIKFVEYGEFGDIRSEHAGGVRRVHRARRRQMAWCRHQRPYHR